jgi:AcrR family transcriptional regulator
MTPPRDATTREALLDAAEDLFSELGYHAVGTRELCARAGANLSAVKYHFGGKHELYLETVRRAMERRECVEAWGELQRRPESRAEAATALVHFTRGVLEGLDGHSGLSSCARLLLHEASHPSEALDDVVSSFMRPNVELLMDVISVLLPDAGKRELGFTARSVLGQLLHYIAMRPIVERSGGLDLSDAAIRREAADHVARFSLRGLRVPEDVVDAALASTPVVPVDPVDPGGRA